MRIILLLLLTCGVAHAQSYPQWQEGYVPGVSINPARPIPTTGCTPAAQGAPVTCGSWLDWLGSKLDVGGDASALHVTPPGGAAQTLAGLYSQVYAVPDWYHQSADGADDAPEIARAQATGLPLLFECHHYAINSPINVVTLAKWSGCGFNTEPGPLSAATGTWLDIGPAFIGNPLAPITIFGNATTGSLIEDFAVDEPGMPAAPTPIVNSSNQVTGWSPATWTAAAYTEVFRVNYSSDTMLRRIFCDGVNACASATYSGRAQFEDFRGQAFAYMVAINESYDVTRIVDVHQWPFWSQADPVIQFQQAHLQTIISNRNDTPFIDRIFTFGSNVGISLGSNADGSTTGMSIGNVSCDFTAHCLQVQPGASVDGEAKSIRSYGQAWNTVSGAAVALIPGSDVLEIGDGTVLHVGFLDDYGSDHTAINFTNGAAASASNVHINALLDQFHSASANGNVVNFPTTGAGQNLLTVDFVALGQSSPSGITLTNTAPSQGGGLGTLQTATYATQH